MELLLIRHGRPQRVETEDGSPADPPLSDAGHAQAAALARWLRAERIDRVYSSPMRRAHETAEPLARAFAHGIELEPGVRELDAEFDSYVPLEELKETDPEGYREAIQGGIFQEVDMDAFRREATAAIERIARDNAGGRVAIVCHGGVINAWATHLLGIDAPMFFLPNYTSISRFLAASSGERSVLSLNECAHLRELEPGA